MFAIRFLPGLTEDGRAAGELVLGEDTEGFHADLGFWAQEDYERQWVRSVARLVGGSAKKGCLVTSVPPLETANFVSWWVLYVIGPDVVAQEQILFLEELDSPFRPETPEVHVRERATQTDEGQAISEWRVPLAAVEAFLASTSVGGGDFSA